MTVCPRLAVCTVVALSLLIEHASEMEGNQG